MFNLPDKYKIASMEGAFLIPSQRRPRKLQVIASLDGDEWEHVSVVAVNGKHQHIPTWEEMCQVKDLFWGDEDEVVQFHPAKSAYVNVHQCVLHLWRHTKFNFPSRG